MPNCEGVDDALLNAGGCTASGAVQGVANDALEQLRQALVEATTEIAKFYATLWTSIPTPQVTARPGEGRGDLHSAVEQNHGVIDGPLQVASWVGYVVIALCVLGIIAVAVRMAVQHRRGEGALHIPRLGWVLFAGILAGAAPSLVAGFMPDRGASGATTAVAFVQNSVWWFTALMAVISILIAAGRMAWQQRADPGKDLLRSIMTLLVVSGAGVAGIGLLTASTDAFSNWIIDRSVGDQFGPKLLDMIAFDTVKSGGIGVLLGIIILCMFCITSFVQIALMVIRGGVIVVLAGVWPLTASFTNLEAGRAWFQKTTGWLLAFILYKPVAAIVYATAFQLMSDPAYKNGDLLHMISGVGLLLAAVCALPALMKLVAPMVGPAVGGGTGAAMAGIAAGAGAAGAVATGAVDRGSSRSHSSTSTSTSTKTNPGPTGSQTGKSPQTSEPTSASGSGKGPGGPKPTPSVTDAGTGSAATGGPVAGVVVATKTAEQVGAEGAKQVGNITNEGVGGE